MEYRAEAVPAKEEGNCSFAVLPSFLLRGSWSLGQGGRRRWRVPSPAGTEQKTFAFLSCIRSVEILPCNKV